MRVVFAVALIVLGIAGVSAASAADLSIDRSANYSFRSYAIGERAAPLVVYDYQPGVLVRAYWLAPWRHHHYFPHTGKRPVIGRAENLSAKRSAPQPAKTFQRSWSTASALLSAPPRGRVRPLDAEPAPRMELPRQIPGPLK